MSRKDIALCVQLSFDDPVATLGRPRTQAVGGVVQKIVVFQGAHADGDKHVHVAVQLQKSRSFAPAKTTLRRPCGHGTTWQHTSQASIRNSGLQSVMATCQH